MKMPAEIDIVRRAYELWQQAGEPEGKDQEFYQSKSCETQTNLPLCANLTISDEQDSPKSGATQTPAETTTPGVNK